MKQIKNLKFNILWNIGKNFHLIEDYPKELWEEIKKHYYYGTPLFVLLQEGFNIGKCYDRSYALTMAFKNCKLIRGSLPKYGEIHNIEYDPDFGHGWVEDNKYVYDTTFMKRFNKKFYYHLFQAQADTIISSDELNNDENYKKMKATTKKDIENSIGLDAMNAWLLDEILKQQENINKKDLSYLKCEIPKTNMKEIEIKQNKRLKDMAQDR